MYGKGLSFAGMHMVKVICSYWKSVLNKIGCIPSSTFSENDFSTFAISRKLIIISPKLFMENAPAFSIIGLSTRVEIYAPPGQRHKVPATCRGGGHRPPRYICPDIWHILNLQVSSIRCSCCLNHVQLDNAAYSLHFLYLTSI